MNTFFFLTRKFDDESKVIKSHLELCIVDLLTFLRNSVNFNFLFIFGTIHYYILSSVCALNPLCKLQLLFFFINGHMLLCWTTLLYRSWPTLILAESAGTHQDNFLTKIDQRFWIGRIDETKKKLFIVRTHVQWCIQPHFLVYIVHTTQIILFSVHKLIATFFGVMDEKCIKSCTMYILKCTAHSRVMLILLVF